MVNTVVLHPNQGELISGARARPCAVQHMRRDHRHWKHRLDLCSSALWHAAVTSVRWTQVGTQHSLMVLSFRRGTAPH